MLQKIWKNEDGGVTLEWMFLFTLLIIGIVGGFTIIRDALVVEGAETAGATLALNTDYSVNSPPSIQMIGGNGAPVTPPAELYGFKHEGSTRFSSSVSTQKDQED